MSERERDREGGERGRGKEKERKRGKHSKMHYSFPSGCGSSSSIATRDNPDNRVRNFGSRIILTHEWASKVRLSKEAVPRDRIKIMFRAAVFLSLFLAERTYERVESRGWFKLSAGSTKTFLSTSRVG